VWFDGVLRLWEVSTGRERCRLAGPAQDGFTTVTAVPGGRLLATGGRSGEVTVWDVPALLRGGQQGRKVLSAGDLERLWTDLASVDAARAARAIGDGVAAPGQVTVLLGRRLRPADSRLVARWIADLDSEHFAERERASQALEGLGEAAEPALRKALEAPASPEVRRRVEDLLERRGRQGLSAERLRELRAVELLESIGTAEARQVLGVLAQGERQAGLTREAKAALERLARRATASP
jgi:hypothetical protein